MYAWGPNDEGPTGGLYGDPVAERDVSFQPTKIAEMDDINIVEIQTGPNSIIAVSDTGEVFTWGSNSDGRLGYFSDGSVYFPQQVEFDADLHHSSNALTRPTTVGMWPMTLTFTEVVEAGEDVITLVNRDSGARAD